MVRWTARYGMLLTQLFGGWAYAQEEPTEPELIEIAVVAHASVPVDDLRVDQLREVLLGRKRFWSDGVRIELVVEANEGPAREMFVSGVSGMSELRFRQYWINQIFVGRATGAPRAAPDRRLALALIAAIPGSIGLVEAGEFPNGVRILKIQGQSVYDASYPLVYDDK